MADDFYALRNTCHWSVFLLKKLYSGFGRWTLLHWKQESNMLFAIILNWSWWHENMQLQLH